MTDEVMGFTLEASEEEGAPAFSAAAFSRILAMRGLTLSPAVIVVAGLPSFDVVDATLLADLYSLVAEPLTAAFSFRAYGSQMFSENSNT